MRLAHPEESVFAIKIAKTLMRWTLLFAVFGLGKLTWPIQSLQICENDLTPWVEFYWQSLGNTLRSRKLVCAGARSPQTTSPPPAISPPCLENSRFHFSCCCSCAWLFQCSGTAMIVWRQWCTCVGARSENFPAMKGRLSTPQAPCPTTLQAPYNENGGGRTRKEKRIEGEVKIMENKVQVKLMYIQHIAGTMVVHMKH